MKGKRDVFTLPPLPYAYDSLEPFVSAQTMYFHHDFLHARYVEKLNAGNLSPEAYEFNLGGNWLHSLLWPSWRASSARAVPGPWLSRVIARDFGGLDGLRERMVSAATKIQGSGWVLLSAHRGRLFVEVAANHGTRDQWPRTVLPLDAWEHAYFLDRGPERKEWAEIAFDHLTEWSIVERRAREQGVRDA